MVKIDTVLDFVPGSTGNVKFPLGSRGIINMNSKNRALSMAFRILVPVFCYINKMFSAQACTCQCSVEFSGIHPEVQNCSSQIPVLSDFPAPTSSPEARKQTFPKLEEASVTVITGQNTMHACWHRIGSPISLVTIKKTCLSLRVLSGLAYQYLIWLPMPMSI